MVKKGKPKKEENYVVLGGAINTRDGMPAYRDRKNFTTPAEATTHVLHNLPARLFMRAPFLEDLSGAHASERPYALVVEYFGKHHRPTGGGETNYATSHEVTLFDSIASAAAAVASRVKEDEFRHAEVCLELRLGYTPKAHLG